VASGKVAVEDLPLGAAKHWQVFRAAYATELSDKATLVARAFVEAAAAVSGVALFLCAEESIPEFDSLNQAGQDEVYCHRFTLAAPVARSLSRDFPSARIERLSLKLGSASVTDLWMDVEGFCSAAKR
jgi:hypothetical protein